MYNGVLFVNGNHDNLKFNIKNTLSVNNRIKSIVVYIDIGETLASSIFYRLVYYTDFTSSTHTPYAMIAKIRADGVSLARIHICAY